MYDITVPRSCSFVISGTLERMILGLVGWNGVPRTCHRKDSFNEIGVAFFEEWNVSENDAENVANSDIFEMLMIEITAQLIPCQN